MQVINTSHSDMDRLKNTFSIGAFTPEYFFALSWEKKVPISDWLGGLQTTPCKTPKKLCGLFFLWQMPLYLLVFAGISISISIRPAYQRRETNLWQHKKKHGSGGVMRRCRHSGDLLGDFRPGTSGGSICREVVCGLPVNPKQKK